MRFYLLLLLAFTSTVFAQSRGRCGEIINNQQAPEQTLSYDAEDYIDAKAITKFIRGEHVIVSYNHQNYVINNYAFSNYYPDNINDHDDVAFVKMIRGEEVIVCNGTNCYKGVPAGAYQKTNSSPVQTIRIEGPCRGTIIELPIDESSADPYQNTNNYRRFEGPCRGTDDSRECRPSGRG